MIPSKQRPRKCYIRGTDGADYLFLLKGHEDLRQDEVRVCACVPLKGLRLFRARLLTLHAFSV